MTSTQKHQHQHSQHDDVVKPRPSSSQAQQQQRPLAAPAHQKSNAQLDVFDEDYERKKKDIPLPDEPIISGQDPRKSTPNYAWMVAMYLQDRCNDNRQLDGTHLTRFHSSRVPPISIPDYFKRIDKYSFCSAESHIVALVLIERYCEASQIPITFRNVHRLAIVSVMIAAKLRDDIFYSNQYFASIGGVSNPEVNELEVEFLSYIQWNTWVGSSEFEQYDEALQERFGVGPPSVHSAAAQQERAAAASSSSAGQQQQQQQGQQQQQQRAK